MSLMSIAGTARAEAPQDFAYRVEVGATPGLNVITLSEAVYRAAQTADLRDLRIFNGKGEALPLTPLPAPKAAPGPTHELRMVPLPGQVQARDKVLADFALRIEREGTRSVIELAPIAPQAAAAEETGGYLLDLRPHRDVDGELVLRFATDAPDFTGRIEFFGSDDLYVWRPITSGALVRNRQLGDTIERTVFPVGRVAPFMRLGWTNTRAPRLEGAQLVERGTAPALPRTTLAVARAEAAASWFVDVPQALPVVLLRVRAPQDNVVVRVRVFRYDDRDPRPRARLSLHARRAPEHWIAEGGPRDVFRLNRDGQWIESPPFALSARTTQLRIDAIDSAGFTEAPPIVEAEWLPQRYMFAASEPGPYLLAIGNDSGDLKPGPTLDARNVLPQDDAAGTRLPVAQWVTATTSGTTDPQRAQRIAREASWSRYVLWGVLLAAVVALALMAWAIAAQIKRGRPAPAKPDTGTSASSSG